MNPTLRRKLDNIPLSPGVYLMKDGSGEVIYIGKAVSLKKRVLSYFRDSISDTRPAACHIGTKAEDLDFIVTRNETEAFLLENNLIKKFKPRYNIRLRDDKTFLSLKVDLRHPFPAVVPVRRPKRDKALYFGPYTSAGAMRSILRFLRTVAPLRLCSDREFKNRSRPCIQHQIHRCSAPCCGLITREAYRADLDTALEILKGKVDDLKESLRAEMNRAAEEMKYEEAARMRDRIKHLDTFTTTQKVQLVRFQDADVIGFHREGRFFEVAVLFFRDGKLVASSPFSFELDFEPEEIISQFVLRFYGERRHIPAEIFLPVSLPDMEFVEKYLKSRRQGTVRIKIPRRGNAVKLMDMAAENARLALRASRGIREVAASVAETLRVSLKMEKTPLRIEGVDISNTSGGQAVGSLVHFRDGEPLKSRYRRFRVKTVEGADDYAMIREIVFRRFKRGLTERNLPDLLLVDGGPGQVAQAVQAAAKAGVSSCAVAGMAKGESRARAVAASAGKTDRIYLPGSREPIDLLPDSDAFRLLQRVRDESHRFAVAYHRRLRGKASFSSPLDSLHGLGKERRRRVLERFGGLRGLRAASMEDIMAVKGIGPLLARKIVEAVRGERQ